MPPNSTAKRYDDAPRPRPASAFGASSRPPRPHSTDGRPRPASSLARLPGASGCLRVCVRLPRGRFRHKPELPLPLELWPAHG
ncbi:hypothetical protein T484DRAFT_1821019 [Baffinella frigidus]|nr:hypothetical protein T484DRAFT_1821019 [Cryptophyta sp. CCMP2293]